MKQIITILFFATLPSQLGAQTNKGYQLVLKEGEKGVYVFGGSADAAPQPLAPAKIYVAEGSRDYRYLGNTGMAKNEGEFTFLAGENVLTDIARMKKLPDSRAAFEYLKTHTDLKEYGLAALNIGFLQAMGYCYLDEKTKEPGSWKQLHYKLEMTGAPNTIAEATIRTGVLPAIARPLSTERHTTDSSVRILWESSVPEGNEALFATVYRQEGNKGGYTKVGTAIAAKAKDKKTIKYQFHDLVHPDINYDYYILPLTLTRLGGPASDTVKLISHDFSRRPSLALQTVKDTNTGIYMQWDPVPQTEWYTGIVIERKLPVEVKFVAIDTVSNETIGFTDTRVLPAQMYQYRLRMLSITGEVSDPGVHKGAVHKNRNAQPEAPEEVKAKLNQQNGVVSISWKKSTLPFTAGYLVYRVAEDDSTNRMVSTQLYTTSFNDTLQEYKSGQYKYFVVALNYEDVRSVPSNPAFVQWSNGKASQMVPIGLRGYATPGQASLSWRDLRTDNPGIMSYNLYRRKGEMKEGPFSGKEQMMKAGFVKINKEALYAATFTDRDPEDGVKYTYMVTTINQQNIEGAPGISLTLDIPEIQIAAPAGVSLRRTSGGIAIEWGVVTDEGVKGYEIYRRSMDEDKAALIAKVDLVSYSYTDNSAKPGILYFYTVRTLGEQKTSSMSEEKSIRP